MKKLRSLFGALAVVILASVLLTGCGKKKVEEETGTQNKPIEQVNLILVDERPYVSILPDQKGRNLVFTLHDLKKPAQKAELEVEYQSGTQLQGAFLSFKLSALPDSQDMLLGSCSAGGKCSYHENVTGGNILLRFTGDEKYFLKSDWAFIENKDEEEIFSSQDSKFRIEGVGLANISHGVILQSPGLPENVDQELLSSPYSVGLITSPKGKISVSLRLSQETDTATILGWDGKQWQTLDTTVAEKVATATDELYDAYVAVK